ncbi:hypothetical protein [Belnapia arida]|uniref:hypothetical protein n=1 Tax=Belnapia arida TaxID=2804533 RepID=UPI0038B2776B
MIPAQFRVLVAKRLKLACRVCPGVVLQASAPARLIVKRPRQGPLRRAYTRAAAGTGT